MKRIILFFLLLSLCLSGCSSLGERIKEPVTFYYPRSEYSYFSPDGVIVSEEREASGHKDDLNYLLALYLMGPTTEGLVSSFPPTTKIFSLSATKKEITIQITNYDSTMSDVNFSLACACVSMTCFELSDCELVTVKSGNRSVSIARNSTTLSDSGANLMEENQ